VWLGSTKTMVQSCKWLASGPLGSVVPSCGGGDGGGWKNWLCDGDGG
jgi:hypothetical protein